MRAYKCAYGYQNNEHIRLNHFKEKTGREGFLVIWYHQGFKSCKSFPTADLALEYIRRISQEFYPAENFFR
jgi:hypothetical protein